MLTSMQEQRQKRIYGKHLQVNHRQEISTHILLRLQKKQGMSRSLHCS